MSTKVTLTLTLASAGHKRTEQWTYETASRITQEEEDLLVQATENHAAKIEADPLGLVDE